MQAALIYHFKELVNGKHILEMTIHSVGDFERFPDGVKYSLIFIDPKTGEKVLMDNHHPKGHHVHLGETELDYIYKSEQDLIADFKSFVFQHMGVKL